MNALVDVDVIDALYAASQAGVDIHAPRARHLLPAARHPGRLASASRCARIVDRFLEHGRVFRFAQRRQRRGLHLERRLDAAQLPPPRRGDDSHPRSERPRAHGGGRRTSRRPTHEDLGARRPTAATRACTPRRRAARARRSSASSSSRKERVKQNDALARGGRFHILACRRARASKKRGAARTARRRRACSNGSERERQGRGASAHAHRRDDRRLLVAGLNRHVADAGNPEGDSIAVADAPRIMSAVPKFLRGVSSRVPQNTGPSQYTSMRPTAEAVRPEPRMSTTRPPVVASTPPTIILVL